MTEAVSRMPSRVAHMSITARFIRRQLTCTNFHWCVTVVRGDLWRNDQGEQKQWQRPSCLVPGYSQDPDMLR